jgi:hypothetical protein
MRISGMERILVYCNPEIMNRLKVEVQLGKIKLTKYF